MTIRGKVTGLVAAMAMLAPVSMAHGQVAQESAVEEIQVVGERTKVGSVAYKELAEIIRYFEDIPPGERRHLQLDFQLERRKKKGKVRTDPVELFVTMPGEEVRIEVTDDGHFTLPLRQDWIDREAEFVTNQPSGTLGIRLGLIVVQGEGDGLRYAELRRAAKVLDDAIENVVGSALGFFIPSVSGYAFRCDPQPDCRIDFTTSESIPLWRDDDGLPLIKLSRALDAKDPEFRFTGDYRRIVLIPQAPLF